jgi:hypothetical protein
MVVTTGVVDAGRRNGPTPALTAPTWAAADVLAVICSGVGAGMKVVQVAKGGPVPVNILELGSTGVWSWVAPELEVSDIKHGDGRNPRLVDECSGPAGLKVCWLKDLPWL